MAGAKAATWAARNAERVRARSAPTAIVEGELRKSGDTRARILDAAIRSLVEDGYQRLSIGAVADRAELTRATVIYHFAGREALLYAVATYLLDRRNQVYWDAVRNVPDGPEQIAIFVETYWRQVDGPLFAAFVELLVAARTDRALKDMLDPLLALFDEQRARHSRLIFSHEMRAAAGDRFETIRDVARFLIEGMAFAAMTTDLDAARIDRVKAFLIAEMEASYRTA